LAVCAFLLVYNNVVQLVPAQRSLYVPMNLVVAAGLVAAARRRGLTWHDVGLSRDRARSGLIWGAVPAAIVAVGYAAVLLSPARDVLDDERYAGLSPSRLLYVTLVRIPLGTVVLEEVAFRGVLLAAAARAWSVRWAVVVSSAVFGLWHIRPTLSALAVNDLGGSLLSKVAGVGAAVVFTAGAGALFAWLRLRSVSLLAPMVLHVTTNSVGVVAAFLAHRWT
jgi:membrane protease YdiL (CAAX protease family)